MIFDPDLDDEATIPEVHTIHQCVSDDRFHPGAPEQCRECRYVRTLRELGLPDLRRPRR